MDIEDIEFLTWLYDILREITGAYPTTLTLLELLYDISLISLSQMSSPDKHPFEIILGNI